MEPTAPGTSAVRALLERMHDGPARELHLERRPLRGGLESAGVARVVARWRDHLGRRRVFTLVAKRLDGPGAREARVYEHLVAAHAPHLAPKLFSAHHDAPDRTLLYLEAVRPSRTWPWRDTGAAAAVLAHAAHLHESDPLPAALAALSEWDYEAELEASAAVTLERLERVRRDPEFAPLARGLPWAGRLARSLAELRRQLLDASPFGRAAIHGDLHPGNAIVRRRRGRDEAVLLDWGRARIGSPLEDVSSWLQSLAGWEPEARRRHDTLFAGYLGRRGMETRLGSEVRTAYWLAGASNALSGALAYHLSVLLHPATTPAQRGQAAYSAREWLRVLRRADSAWS